MKAVHNPTLVKRLLLSFLAGIFLSCGGQQNRDNESGATSLPDTLDAGTTETPVLTAGMMAGKAVYEQYCMTCHQANGKGVSSLNPPLAGAEYVTGDKDRLIKIVLNGSNVGLEVNGIVYSNAMPPHAFLDDGEIANVLSYIRNSFGNEADTVSTSEVKKVRASL